jgi:hypothetical protein
VPGFYGEAGRFRQKNAWHAIGWCHVSRLPDEIVRRDVSAVVISAAAFSAR